MCVAIHSYFTWLFSVYFAPVGKNGIADYWMVNNFNTNELNLWMVYHVAT